MRTCSSARSAPSPAASIRRCARSAPSAARRASSRAGQGPTSGTRTASSTSTTVGSWGPMILGHAHPEVLEAVSARGARRPVLRRADRGRSRNRRTPRAHAAVDRTGAPGLLRHRSDHERDPSGARLHRTRAHQVRRLLSRPRRQPAGEGRLRRADLRRSELGRRAGRDAQHTIVLDYNDCRRSRSVRSAWARDRLRDRRAGRGQHEPGARQRRVPAGACAACARATARC